MADTLTVPTTTTVTNPPPQTAPSDNKVVSLPTAAPINAAVDVDPTEGQADAAVRATINAVPPRPTMQMSMANAVSTNPDMEAEARRVAARTGVPVQTVFAQPDLMKQKAALGDIDFDQYEKLYPASALALSKEELAKVAHDDIDNMGQHEGVLKSLGTNFALSAARMYLGAKTQVADLTGNQDMARDALFDIGAANTLEAETRPEFDSWLGRETYGAASGLVNSAPVLMSAFINPLLAVAGFGAQAETTAYGKYRERGGTPGEAATGAGLEGGIAVATSFLPVKFLSEKLGKVGAGQFLSGLLARDVPAMVAQNIGNAAVDESVANPNGSLEHFIKELPQDVGSALVNAVVTAGTMTGVHGGVNYVKNAPLRTAARISATEQARAAQGEADGAQFENMNNLAAESKLRARDPLAFQNFINEVSKSEGAIENVYADPRALAQSGVDLTKLAEASPSIAEQYRVALETGGDMKIPVSEYASHLAGTELGQAMVDHLKTSPLSMSRAEAREFMQGHAEQLKTDVEKAVKEQTVDDDFQKSADVVKDDLLGKLTQANRFTKDVNDQYASMLGQFYKVQAARLGTTPEALYKAHPVDIKSVFDKGSTLSQGARPDGEDFFEPKALEAARAQNDKSRDKLIYMHPQDFLDVATSGSDKKKAETVRGLIESRTKFNDVPFLGFTHDGEGTAQVTSHEGRHRARELLAAGVTEMPVLLQHRYDENGQAMRWGELSKDFKDSYPKKLYAQVGGDTASSHNKGKSIDFPVPDPRELAQGEDGTIARGSFNPDTNTITLLKNADLSTFLHESGHFFLETMNKLALDEKAPPEIKADMDATLKWLGVKDLAEWNAHDLEWQRDKHEQFARGFEAYLFEGKSPSVEMRGVFQRFRAWLLNVYRQMRALDVELNPEVRGVFDRMLATSDQIKETELARSFEPMFSEARAAGMNKDEWQQYQEMGVQATQDALTNLESRSMRDMKWLSNARSRAMKDLQREAAGRRREIRDQVTKEVMEEPVNQARTFLTRGEINGEPVLEGGTKLYLPEIEAMYGDNPIVGLIKKELGFGKYGMLGNDKGMHPDQVAEMFGFSSGDELVRTLLSAEKPRDKINGLTDQRMLEKYGDLTNPEAIARAADEAIHNDVRSRFIATELDALQKAAGGKKILAKAAKEFADNMVARLRVRDVSPSRYSAAEARAARDAAESFKAGGLAAAAVAKRNQLIQNYAARAAHDAVRDIEKAVQYFKGFDREGTRKNIADSSLEQIDALLDRFDLRKGQSLKAIDRRTSLMNWKASQEELGLEPEIPPELLDEAMRKHYKDMTVEELRGLRDTIKQIDHLGRLKNKLLTAKDNRDFKTTVDGLVASITENAHGRVVDNRTRATKKDQAIRLFKGFVASHRKMASLAREMDGVKDAGPMWETFIRTMNEAGDKEASMRAKATKDVAKLIKPLLAEGGKMGGKGEFFPSIGKSLNREERIGMALNMGNKGNMQRLLDGEGWKMEQLRPVLETLNKNDWDFVQHIWDFFESYRPEIGAKEKRVYGKEPDWIDPNPVQTKFGEYRGGYYPIKYDTRRSIAAEQHSDAEFAKQQMKGAYTSATTRRSFTKSRADEVKGRPLLYAMDGLYSGVNEIIHDLSWHEWLIDANRLLRNKALDGAMRTGYGTDVVRQYKDAVRDIAGGEMPTGTSFEKGIADLRGGAVVAGLGFNIVNSIINLTGVTNSVVRTGPKWVAMGVAKWAQNPRALTATVHEKSEFMRLRTQTMLREINEIQSQVRGKSRARAVADTMMFAPMTMTQLAVDVPVWWGAYQRALTEGHPDDKAVAIADQHVLDAQSGGQVKDLAGIQRGGPMQKLFTTFYGYFNASYNLGVERTKATNFKDPVSVMKLGGDYLMLYTVPVVLGRIIMTALTGGKDDWDVEKLAKNMANDQISYLMGTMVGLREVTGAVQTVAGVNPYTSSYGGPAGLRFFQEIFNLATQVHQGKADEALAKSVMNILGIAFHLPAAQINRTVSGVAALVDGKTENPAAVIAGPPRK